MDNSTNTNQSLRATFDRAEALRASLEKTHDCNCESYQTKLKSTIKTYEECKKLVAGLSLFSPNETLEDVSSPEIRYVRIVITVSSDQPLTGLFLDTCSLVSTLASL